MKVMMLSRVQYCRSLPRLQVIPAYSFMFFIWPGQFLILLVIILQQQSKALAHLQTKSSTTTTITTTTEWDLLPSSSFQSYSSATLSPTFDVKKKNMKTRSSEALTNSDHSSIQISNGNFNENTLQKHSLTRDSTTVLSMTSTPNSIGFHTQLSSSGCFSSHCRFAPSSSFTISGTVISIRGRPASSQLTPESSSRLNISGSPLAGPTSAMKTSSPGFIIMADAIATTMGLHHRPKKKRHKIHLHSAPFIYPSLTKNQIPTPIVNSNTQESVNIQNYETTPYFMAKSSESKPVSLELNTLSSSFSSHSIYKSDLSERQSSFLPLETSFSSLRNFPDKDNMFHSIHPTISSDIEPPLSQSLSQLKISIHPTPSKQSTILHSPTKQTAFMNSTNSVNSTKNTTLESILIFQARHPPIIKKSFEINEHFLTTSTLIENSVFQALPQIYSSNSMVEPELSNNAFSTVSDQSVSKAQFPSSLTPLSVSDVSGNLNIMDILDLIDTVLNYTNTNDPNRIESPTLCSSASTCASPTPGLSSSHSFFPLRFYSQIRAKHERTMESDHLTLSSRDFTSKNHLFNNFKHFRKSFLHSNSVDQSVYPSLSSDFVSNLVSSSKLHPYFSKEFLEAEFSSFADSVSPTTIFPRELFTDFALTDSSQPLSWPDIHSTIPMNDYPPLETSFLSTFDTDVTHTPLPAWFTLETPVNPHTHQTLNTFGDEKIFNWAFDSQKIQNQKHSSDIFHQTTDITASHITNNFIPIASLLLPLEQESRSASNFMSSYSQKNIFSDDFSLLTHQEPGHDSADVLSSSFLEIVSSDLASPKTSMETTTPNMASLFMPPESLMLSITSSTNTLSSSLLESYSQSQSSVPIIDRGSIMASSTGDSINTLFSTPQLSNLFFPSAGVDPDSWTAPDFSTVEYRAFINDLNGELVDGDVSITTEQLTSSEYENGLLSHELSVSTDRFTEYQEFSRKEIFASSFAFTDLHSQSKLSDSTWTFDSDTVEDDLVFSSYPESGLIPPASDSESVDSSTVQLTRYMSSNFVLESSSASLVRMLPSFSLLQKLRDAETTNDPALIGSVDMVSSNPFDYSSPMDLASETWDFPLSDQYLELSQSSPQISSSHFESLSEFVNQSLPTSQAENSSQLMSHQSTSVTNSSSHLYSSFSFLEPSKVTSQSILLPVSSQESIHSESSQIISDPSFSSLLELSEQTSPLLYWLDSSSVASQIFPWFEASQLTSSEMVEQSQPSSQFLFEVEPSEWTSQVESLPVLQSLSHEESISMDIDSTWIHMQSEYLSSVSQLSSQLEKLQPTSQLKSSLYTSNLSAAFAVPIHYQSSQLTSKMLTELMPSSSSKFASQVSSQIMPSLSSKFTSQMSLQIMPSQSSEFTSQMSSLIMPSQSSKFTSKMSSLIMPSQLSKFTSQMSSLIMPSQSSKFTSQASSHIMPSQSSKFTSQMSSLIMPSQLSKFTSQMSSLIMPSQSSKFTSQTSSHIMPSQSSKFTSQASSHIMPSQSSKFTSQMSSHIMPSQSSKFTSQMSSQILPSLSSKFSSRISSQIMPSLSSQFTAQMSKLLPFTTQIDSFHPELNLSTGAETLQLTSSQLSSQTEFPHQTLLLSSEIQSLNLESTSKLTSQTRSSLSTLQTSLQSDLLHQSSQFSSYSDSSHSHSSLHPSSSPSKQTSQSSIPLFSPELGTAYSTEFSSQLETFHSTSDLTSLIMSSYPESQLHTTFSFPPHSIHPKLNSSWFGLRTQSTIKTEMNSVSSFASTLMPTLSVTQTLNHEFNSTSLFYSTTKFANHSTSDVDKGTNPTTPLDITLPTTPEPMLNLSQAFQNYWVITVIKVRLSVNVSTMAFRKEMERNLARAYAEAYHIGERILNGTYQPLRKKRFALVQDIALQMINITRSQTNSSNNVTLIYYMEKRGKPVPAISAARHLKLLQPQELAIHLKQVVVVPATTYLKPPHPEPSKDWIIGAVLGTLSSALLLIWCILFIYFKCFRMRPTKSIHTKSATPQLVLSTSMQDMTTDTSETVLTQDEMQIQRQTYLLKKNGFKKQTYSVALPKVGRKGKMESESEEPTRDNSDGKKKMKPTRRAVNGKIGKKAEVKPEVKINVINIPQKQNGHVVREHNGYSKETDNYSDYEVEPPSVQMPPSLSINGCTNSERLSPFHYVNLPPIQHNFSLTASRQEADDELRHQADHLRRIQKQRLKEARRKMRHVELYQNSPHYFLNHSQDMEMVSNGLRTETVDESHLDESRRGSRRRRYKRREKHDFSSQEDSSLNDPYEGDEPETLQRTREKMHKLLDDAFQMIARHEKKKVPPSITPLGCTRRSSIGKRRTRRQRPNLLETPPVPCHRKSSPSDSTPEEKLDRLHTPLFLHKHYSPCNRHRVNPAIPPPWNAAGDEAAKIAAEHQAWSSPYVSPRLSRPKILLNPSDPREEMCLPSISYPRDHNLTDFGCQPFSFSRTRLSSQFSPYASSRPTFHNRHSGYHSVDNSDDTPTSLFQPSTPCYPPHIENSIELNTFEPPSFAKHLSRSPASSKTSPVDDEIDAIHNNVKQESAPQPLIQSIREELMRLSNEKGERNSLRSRIVFG